MWAGKHATCARCWEVAMEDVAGLDCSLAWFHTWPKSQPDPCLRGSNEAPSPQLYISTIKSSVQQTHLRNTPSCFPPPTLTFLSWTFPPFFLPVTPGSLPICASLVLDLIVCHFFSFSKSRTRKSIKLVHPQVTEDTLLMRSWDFEPVDFSSLPTQPAPFWWGIAEASLASSYWEDKAHSWKRGDCL